jgi:predicted DNA-binding transcriptional regulator AlpA
MNAIGTEHDATLLSPQQVSELLGVAPTTLTYWRKKSEGPPSIKISPKFWRYRQDALLEWLDRQKVAGA